MIPEGVPDVPVDVCVMRKRWHPEEIYSRGLENGENGATAREHPRWRGTEANHDLKIAEQRERVKQPLYPGRDFGVLGSETRTQ